jgi:hypothetical protein
MISEAQSRPASNILTGRGMGLDAETRSRGGRRGKSTERPETWAPASSSVFPFPVFSAFFSATQRLRVKIGGLKLLRRHHGI